MKEVETEDLKVRSHLTRAKVTEAVKQLVQVDLMHPNFPAVVDVSRAALQLCVNIEDIISHCWQ